MKKFNAIKGSLVLLIAIAGLFACQKNINMDNRGIGEAMREKEPQTLKDFTQVNLVASREGYNAAFVDPGLVNPWGLAFSPTGIAWPASAGSGLSQLYTQTGSTVRPAVAIPSPGGPDHGHPSGIVFSGGQGFMLSNGAAANFIFAGLDGVISGWNGAAGNFAIKMLDNSSTSVYTGLAIGSSNAANYIYAANFRQGTIDVFNTSFQPVSMSFTDPDLPPGYSPFNIQRIGNWLYVMYAKVGPDGRDVQQPGLGYVSIFNTDGSFVKRFTSQGQLNAPWGIAKAPAGFWGDGRDKADGAILVGNFGDGHINVFNSEGVFLGQLRSNGEPIVIDGLWAISFAPTTATAIDPGKLFFLAGVNHEMDGLFGYIHK